MILAIGHIVLHLIVPGVVAKVFYNDIWKKAWVLMVATMLVDLDHLLAHPVYDPNRCSIGFHPLHSFFIIPFYMLLLGFKKTRLIGWGLVIHMMLDALDCLFQKMV